jgi:hypothetical protein
MHEKRRTALRNLKISAILSAALLLVLAGMLSPARAEENKSVTLLYTGEFKGQILPRKG